MLLPMLVGCAALAAGLPGASAGLAVPAVLASSQQGAAAGSSSTTVHADSYYQFVLGRRLESQGDFEAAIGAFRRAAALDPRSAEIRAELGGLYARQNRTREAIEWAEAALALDPQNAEANRVLGTIHASQARLDDESPASGTDALDHARKAVRHLEGARKKAGFADANMELTIGRLYLKLGDTERAIATFRRLAEQVPERSEPIAMLAQAYERQGRVDEAVAVLREAVTVHPELYGTLGHLQESQHRWEEAVASYERALGRNPLNLELKIRLGVALLSQGGGAPAARAASILEEVRRQTPVDPQVLYLLAQAQRVAGRLDDAAATARQLASLAPTSFTAPYVLAQVYEQQQDYGRVVEALEPIVSKPAPSGQAASDLAPLVLTLASAYEELGQFDKALATYARARTLAADNLAVDVYELGTLVAARRFDQALHRSTALLDKAPGDARVVRLRAEALRGAGRAVEAVKLLQDAVAREPDDVTGYLALSEMYAATGQHDRGAKLLREAGGRFPGDLTLRFQLGSVLERQGKFVEAERAFREVLAKDPLHAPTLNYLGYMLAERGERLDESIALVKRALQIDPHNGAYLDSLGWAYFKANRLDEAEDPLRKAASRRVRDSAVQDHLGDLLLKLGRPADAVTAWRKALEGDGEQVDKDAIERKIRSASKAAKQ